jgi:hypothetical protein
MSGAGKMTNETETRGGTVASMSSLIPVLTLLVIGYPLAPATIKAILVGWILVVVAITRSFLGVDRQSAERANLLGGDER